MAQERKSRRGNRKSQRKGSRKAGRKAGRKGSRKANRRNTRRSQRGGEAPVGEYGAGSGITPMTLNLAQGQQFAAYHAGQHGGANFGPYPGAVQEASVLPADLVASAKLLPLNQSFDYIRQFGPSSDNPNLKGGKGRKRKGRKASRKSRKGRKQRGGVLVRWGGPAGGGRRSRRRRVMYGGSYAEMKFPMDVSEEGKMLIPPKMVAQAGLNPEWKLAENPASFDPIATK